MEDLHFSKTSELQNDTKWFASKTKIAIETVCDLLWSIPLMDQDRGDLTSSSVPSSERYDTELLQLLAQYVTVSQKWELKQAKEEKTAG